MKSSSAFSKLFKVATGIAAGSPLLIVLVIIVALVMDSIPALRYQGWSFFTGTSWNMGNAYASTLSIHGGEKAAFGATFGILPFIVGTLSTSLIALVIAIPVAVLTALILVYKVPAPLGKVISPIIELLAGIPSVVYGLWGILVVAPFVQHALGPWLMHLGTIIPFLAGPIQTGYGLLTAGLVLAVMIIPIVTATTRDLLTQVPQLPVEGAYALGLTSFEGIRFIALPWIRRGLFGAVVLGWGRALGETMAVLMVSGGAANMPTNLYSAVTTMASAIAADLDSAMNDYTHMSVHALTLLALTLLVITLITNVAARLLVYIGRRGPDVEVQA